MASTWKNILLVFVAITAFIFSSEAQTPQRIVSLAPSLTQSLYRMGIKHKLVGCTSYCLIAQPDSVPHVASTASVNLEKVLNQKPDLVLCTSLTKPKTRDMLKSLGIKLAYFATPTSFAEICDQYLELGKLVGEEEHAKLMIDACSYKVDSLRLVFAEKERPKVFFQIGAKPLYTVIPNTFMNDYITFMHGDNIANDLKSGSITRERVLEQNPDIIFIVTMGLVGDEEQKIWSNYPQLSAVINKRIYIVDSYKACLPTPFSFADTMVEMAALLSGK